MNYYPKAEITITGVDGGPMNRDGSKKLVLHTTETSGGFYTKATYYHIQVWDDNGTIRWRQFIPFDRASRALRNDAGTVLQTNRDGDVNINVAVVGYARHTPDMSDALLRELAEFFVWAQEHWKIPAAFPYAFQGGEAYGVDGVGRLLPAQWDAANGILGHQDVPDGNTHWDPGRLPVPKLQALIAELLTPPEPPEVTNPKGVMSMDAVTLTKHVTPDEIRKLAAAGLFEGNPEYWVARLDQPESPEWERFWTAIYVNSLLA